MKKQVLIIAHSMDIGGIERSLIGLLNVFDTATYDVDVLLYAHRGEFLPLLPARCVLLPEDRRLATLLAPIKSVALAHPLLAAARLAAKGTLLFEKRREGSASRDETGYRLLQAYWEYSVRLFRPLKKEYDAVISFMWPHHFAAKKVKAKHKIAWVHTDFSRVGANRVKDERIWAYFDRIAAVSGDCAKVFQLMNPDLSEKVEVVENVLSRKTIESLSKESVPLDMPEDGCVKLLSVGRFCYAKAYDFAVEICAELLQKNERIKWYFIGYGPEEESVRKKITALGLEEHCILLGKKANPYPYMRACDVYVQPSRYEGKAVTVREAQLLCKPVVITNFKTAASQVRDGADAMVVPMNAQAAAADILALIDDPERRRAFSECCSESDYENTDALNAIYRFIEGG